MLSASTKAKITAVASGVSFGLSIALCGDDGLELKWWLVGCIFGLVAGFRTFKESENQLTVIASMVIATIGFGFLICWQSDQGTALTILRTITAILFIVSQCVRAKLIANTPKNAE